jgi:ankyrin repeat protein
MDVPHSYNKKQKKKKLSAKVWFNAARNGNLAVIQRYLRSGWDVNKQDDYDCYCEWTALHIATICGHIEIVKLLLEHGAGVTSMESDWYMALHLAASRGRLEIVKLLLEHGTDVNILTEFRLRNMFDYTALEIAKQNGHMKVFGFISQWLEQKWNLDPFGTEISSF